MSTIDDGGAAFPHVPVNTETPSKYRGMSLRDYFAGQALAGLATTYGARTAAELAYEMADAALVERKKVKQ
jgi:hypothetical protein